jgi:hypothetical protein
MFRIRPSGLNCITVYLELWVLETVGKTPWTGDQLCRKAATYTGRHKHKRGPTFTSLVGFEPTVPEFESTRTFNALHRTADRLCGLVVRVLDYRCRGLGFDSRALQKKVLGLERSPLSLVSTTEELLDRKVAAPV